MKKTIAICLALVLLSGCGIKPAEVEPPEGANEGDYPRVYPDIKTDPGAEAAKIIK